ncbi:hypothetical protein PR202_ga28581 [Eleusine coracana subsp. coracana]|uniref:Uncharacterized protein n=1 Tax=Eleusine coracana subsp. coracana TaxID=191504 RepID=A0AAV5DHH6_ELECO|nr:hypothetical protein PR202_ga28581 [Eleusine coracana subsp. coracana]
MWRPSGKRSTGRRAQTRRQRRERTLVRAASAMMSRRRRMRTRMSSGSALIQSTPAPAATSLPLSAMGTVVVADGE